jgi:hypothetical protein
MLLFFLGRPVFFLPRLAHSPTAPSHCHPDPAHVPAPHGRHFTACCTAPATPLHHSLRWPSSPTHSHTGDPPLLLSMPEPTPCLSLFFPCVSKKPLSEPPSPSILSMPFCPRLSTPRPPTYSPRPCFAIPEHRRSPVVAGLCRISWSVVAPNHSR